MRRRAGVERSRACDGENYIDRCETMVNPASRAPSFTARMGAFPANEKMRARVRLFIFRRNYSRKHRRL